MATAVNLQINLDNSGAVRGVRQLSDAVDDLGKRAPVAGKKAADAFDGIESSERRAHIAGTLFTRLTGVEMPRAMEQVISRSKLLGPLLAGAFNVAVFATAGSAVLGVVEKLSTLSEEADHHRQSWIAIGGTVQDTGAKIVDALNKEKEKFIEITEGPIAAMKFALGSMRSVAIESFSDIASQMKMVSEQFGSEGGIFTGMGQVNKEASESVKQTLADMDQAMHKAAAEAPKDLMAPLIAEQDVLNKKITEGNDLIKRRSAAMGADKSLVEPLQREVAFYQQLNAQIGLQIDLQKQKTKTAGAEIVEAERKAQNDVVSIQHQAILDQLEGVDKLHQAEIFAIDDVTRNQKDKTIRDQEIAAIKQRTAAETQKYTLQEHDETVALQNEAALAAVKDDQQIIESANIKADKIRELYERGVIDYDNYSARIEAIDNIRNSQLLHNDEERLRRTKELQDKAAEDIATANENAALAGVPEWQRGTAQIEVELNRRVRAIQDEQIKQLAAEKLTADDVVAINKDANAKRFDAFVQADMQLRQEQKRMVEQFGSDLESLANDIGSGNLGKRILDNMKKMFFQMVAAWMLSLNIMKSAFGSLIGNLLFGPNSLGAGVFGGGGGFLGLGAPIAAAAGAASLPGGVVAPSGAPGTTAGGGFDFGGLFPPGVGGGSAALGGTPLSGSAGPGGSLTSSLIGGGSPSGGLSLSGLFGGNGGGLGKGILGGLGAAAMLGLMFGGSKIGGISSQVGLGLLGLALTGKLASAGLVGLGTLGTALIGGAAGGALGFGLGQSFGSVAGGLGGAATGVLVGGLVGGPVGALIAGLIGAIGGIFGGLFGGSKRKKQANAFFDSQVGPSISKIETAYKGFQLDYTSAIGQLEDLRSQAQDQLGKLKSQGKDVFKKKVSPAIDAAEKDINTIEAERQRRAGLVFGPPEFHDGGYVSATMSAFMRRPGELLAVLKHGEFVMNPQATKKNIRALESMNSGGNAGTSHISVTINPASLDQRYLRSGQFPRDLADGIRRAQNEGLL